MKEGESIQTFFSHISTLINQIGSNGDTMKNKKIMQKYLRVLPSRFNYVVATIEVSKDLSKLTLVELMETLIACEERMQKLDDPLKQAEYLQQ